MGLFKKKKKKPDYKHKMLVDYAGGDNYSHTVPVAYKIKGDKKCRRAIGFLERIVQEPEEMSSLLPASLINSASHNRIDETFFIDAYDPLLDEFISHHKWKRDIETIIVNNIVAKQLKLSYYFLSAASKNIAFVGVVESIFFLIPPNSLSVHNLLTVNGRGQYFPENFFFYGKLREMQMISPFRSIRVPSATIKLIGISSATDILGLESLIHMNGDVRIEQF